MDSIILESSDRKKIEIDRDAVKHIGMINNMLQNFKEEAPENNTIKIPGIDSIILDKVLKWAVQRKNEEQKGEKDKNFEDNFIKENNVYLFTLINAANFLDFEDMTQCLCRYVAMKLMNKTVGEMHTDCDITEL